MKSRGFCNNVIEAKSFLSLGCRLLLVAVFARCQEARLVYELMDSDKVHASSGRLSSPVLFSSKKGNPSCIQLWCYRESGCTNTVRACSTCFAKVEGHSFGTSQRLQRFNQQKLQVGMSTKTQASLQRA
eukprot:4790474-Amphidinium_carterae.1